MSLKILYESSWKGYKKGFLRKPEEHGRWYSGQGYTFWTHNHILIEFYSVLGDTHIIFHLNERSCVGSNKHYIYLYIDIISSVNWSMKIICILMIRKSGPSQKLNSKHFRRAICHYMLEDFKKFLWFTALCTLGIYPKETIKKT